MRTDNFRIVLRVLRIPIMRNSIGIPKKRRAFLELSIFSYCAEHIYWAKVLTDHLNNYDNVYVVQYLETNFGALNEKTIWHQSSARAGIWHSACSLHMRIHIKPLKCT